MITFFSNQSNRFELQGKIVRSDFQLLKKFDVLYDSLKQKSISETFENLSLFCLFLAT